MSRVFLWNDVKMCKYTKWSYELVAAEALKYKNRSGFNKGSSSAYRWASRNNLLDEVCSHMPNPRRGMYKMNIATAIEIASECNSPTELWTKSRKAHALLMESDLFEHTCQHMNRRFLWNFDSVLEVAKDCATRQEFQLKNKSAYNWACENKCLDRICQHMEPAFSWGWTTESYVKFANTFHEGLAYFYILNCFDCFENFYVYGKSVYRVDRRYFNLEEKYNYSIIFEDQFAVRFSSELEDYYRIATKKYRYYPEIDVAGFRTESFKCRIDNKLLSF